MRQVAAGQAGRLPTFAAAYLRHRYAFLFYTLLATLAAAPVIDALDLRASLIEFLLALTLATLGYGDIVPRIDIARGLAIEGVGGQLFLAVMVARLVSLYSKEPRAGTPQ
jgi:hypothetical protein